MTSLSKLRTLVVGTATAGVLAFGAAAPPASALPAQAAPIQASSQVVPASAGNLRAIAAMPSAKKSTKNYRATERGLTNKTKRVHRALRAKFPQIKRVLGKRAARSGEHGKGRAIDVMLPNWKSAKGKALGNRIARWARSRAGSLKIYYVIYNQRIWNVQRKDDGWRKMRNGGSATANHKNHVHISVKK